MKQGSLVVVLLLAVMPAAAARSMVGAPGEDPCRTTESRQHNEAVFGHFPTLAAAKKLKADAVARLFQGVKIESEGCGDFEVEIDGADKPADRGSFATEAAKAGFQITFEQTAWPMEFRAGQVVGVIASKTTVGAANALLWRLAPLSFRYIDLARVGGRWLVVMPQVPIKDALSIAHEVATAGFRIQFRAGVKP